MRQKDLAATLGPYDLIIVRVWSIDISEISLNLIIHGPYYIAPQLLVLFERKHHDVTNASNKD